MLLWLTSGAHKNNVLWRWEQQCEEMSHQVAPGLQGKGNENHYYDLIEWASQVLPSQR